ncbi:MAG: CDP-alcohol phosphatidyltransferase family protein, partial [Thermoproteota archaeon]
MKAIILATEKDFIYGENIPLALVKVCGISLIARILNSLRASGVKEILIILGFEGEKIRSIFKSGEDIGLKLFYIEAGKDQENLKDFLNDDILIISVDNVVDGELIEKIIKMKGEFSCYYNDKPIGIYKLNRENAVLLYEYLASSHVKEKLEKIRLQVPRLDVSEMRVESIELKRVIHPVCIKIEDKQSIEIAKRKLVFRAQKGLHFTSYINKPIEDYITYYISDVSWITPNRITVFVNIAAFLVASLFLLMHTSIAAILAYVVGILDGLDGKLARARGTLTRLGHIEHTFDMLYEQTWYICFSLSLYFSESSHLPLVLGLCMLLTDSFVRHCYMQFKEAMGKALTAYTDFDRLFARVDGRRNIYVLYMILFSLLSMPLYAMYAMLMHSSVTAVVYAVRAVQHMSTADEAEGLKGFLKLVG